ncbi:MAG: YfcE family phosphodiesterase [Clostridia bacterium]|nr:YfcE family phosphodiesterase [Clostridia bacterium]
MRILVVSDVHGRTRALCEAIEQQPTAGTVLFLGDGLRQAEDAADRYPDRTFYMVPGNCDMGASLPPVRQETLGGKRFYFTHGHLHDVKYTLYRLDMAARAAGADIVLFGHTHTPYEEYADGLYLFNPGSLGHGGTYGYVDIVGDGIRTAVVSL